MEEEVNQRVVTLSVNTGRMTASVLARTLSNFLAREHQALNRRAEIQKNTEPHGKMTVKELMDQNAGAESVEIKKDNIKTFDRVARKYNVDYALYKNASENPPKYLIFFKARDRDMMTMAFKEFVNENNKKMQKKNMKQKLKEYKDLSKELNQKRAKDKHRSRERSL